MARPAAALALGLGLVLLAGAAQAQDTAVRKPKRPTPPASAVAADAVPPPVTGPDVAGAQVAPLPGADRLRVGPAMSAAPTLRSAVHSRWSAPAAIATQGGGACRSQCAATRITCLAAGGDDEPPRCNAAWTACLSSCDGLGYARAPVPPSP